MRWAKPPRPAKQYEGQGITPRSPGLRVDDGKARMVVPIPKDEPRRDLPYRRWIASRNCDHCGRHGPTQCAHSDSDGKGMAIKAGDDTCYSLCADGPGYRGCHTLIGSSGQLGQAMRRTLESIYAARAQAEAKQAGQWPEGWDV